MADPKGKGRKLLFSTTIADCDVETFRGSGPGGQNRNKVASGVRIRHRESGAVGKATEHRSQHQNKKEAWKRMCETKTFQAWARTKAAKLQGVKSTEQRVEEALAPHNIKTEVLTSEQKWEEKKPEELTGEEE